MQDCRGTIVNCIIWGNNAAYREQIYSGSMPTYSCIQGWTGGTGNIAIDPLFFDAANGEFHLKSEFGRWNSSMLEWVFDDVTSPCIDAGGYWEGSGSSDPNDWTEELWPHGERVNMGAYGGTPQASMSANPVGNIADLDHDDAVGVSDLELFSDAWLYCEYLLDTDLDRDGKVDIADFAELSRQWMWLE